MSWNNPIPWNSRTEPPYDPDGFSAGAANAASVGGGQPKFAAAAAAAGAAASQIASSTINYFSQRATNRANARMNRENNEANLRLWMLNNEYNTPANQRRRMEEAGFNPNLMYGSISPGNSASPSQSEASYNQAPQLSDFGNAIGNAYQMYKQSQLMDKQIEAQELINQGQDIKNKQEQKNLDWMEQRRLEEQRAANDVSKKIMSDIKVNEQSLVESAARVKEIAARENLTLEQAATEVVNRSFLEASFQDRLEQIRLQNYLTRSEIAKANETIKLIAQQVLVAKAQEQSYWEDVNLKNTQGLSIMKHDQFDYVHLSALLEKQFGGLIAIDEDGNVSVNGNAATRGAYRTLNYIGACLSSLLPILSPIKLGGK